MKSGRWPKKKDRHRQDRGEEWSRRRKDTMKKRKSGKWPKKKDRNRSNRQAESARRQDKRRAAKEAAKTWNHCVFGCSG